MLVFDSVLQILSHVLWCLFLFFLQDLKLKFYRLMIESDQHDSAYLSICKHLMAIYNTQVVKDDPQQRKEVHVTDCQMYSAFYYA